MSRCSEKLSTAASSFKINIVYFFPIIVKFETTDVLLRAAIGGSAAAHACPLCVECRSKLGHGSG